MKLLGVAILIALAGCGVTRSLVSPSGVVTIEVVSPGSFRIGTRVYSAKTVPYKIQTISRWDDVTSFEVLVPAALVQGDDGTRCGELVGPINVLDVKVLRYFAWEAGNVASRSPIPCNTVSLAVAF